MSCGAHVRVGPEPAPPASGNTNPDGIDLHGPLCGDHGSLPPQREHQPQCRLNRRHGENALCNTRRSFVCNCRGISPTSSRKMVPPSAASNKPALPLSLAPVNAPFSWQTIQPQANAQKRRTVDGNKVLFSASAALMNACNEFFPDTAFALDQHRCGGPQQRASLAPKLFSYQGC